MASRYRDVRARSCNCGHPEKQLQYVLDPVNSSRLGSEVSDDQRADIETSEGELLFSELDQGTARAGSGVHLKSFR